MAESETMSVDTSYGNADDHIADLTDEQLAQLVSDTLRANEVLQIETQMLEKYLKRVEPKEFNLGSLQPTKDKPSFGSSATLSSHSDPGTSSRLARKRSKSRGSALEKLLRLNPEQKCDIAQKEIEEYQREMKNTSDESERLLDNLKAVLDEAEIRLAEIKKETYEFDRDIAKGAINASTGKVSAEKVTKYLEDKLKERDALTVKLRLKNAALKVQKKKLYMQLRQKEEMGEVLQEVDFSQLKIENQQYIEKIDERNQELLRLKLMAGNTLQVLNSYKKKLQTLMLESERVKVEITARQELLDRIDGETELAAKERAEAEKINKKLRQQLADYKVPEVMEYVMEKADLYELQKKVKSWERKVEIADMALKTHRRTWTKLQLTVPPQQPISNWRPLLAN